MCLWLLPFDYFKAIKREREKNVTYDGVKLTFNPKISNKIILLLVIKSQSVCVIQYLRFLLNNPYFFYHFNALWITISIQSCSHTLVNRFSTHAVCTLKITFNRFSITYWYFSIGFFFLSIKKFIYSLLRSNYFVCYFFCCMIATLDHNICFLFTANLPKHKVFDAF